MKGKSKAYTLAEIRRMQMSRIKKARELAAHFKEGLDTFGLVWLELHERVHGVYNVMMAVHILEKDGYEVEQVIDDLGFRVLVKKREVSACSS